MEHLIQGLVIDLSLRLNIEKLRKDYINIFKKNLEWALGVWKTEAFNRITNEIAVKHGNVDFEVKAKKVSRDIDSVVAYLKANTVSLADSYGTGSLMLDDNPGLEEYKRNSNYNKSRKGKAIAGRPAGTYKNILGETRESKGRYEGDNIEYMYVGKGYTIRPMKPSHAIQDANKFFYKTYLPRVYKLTIDSIDIYKYFEEN